MDFDKEILEQNLQGISFIGKHKYTYVMKMLQNKNQQKRKTLQGGGFINR